jgi:hypothetical protein
MNTQSAGTESADRDELTVHRADAMTVLAHLASGRPLDPAIVARVRARARQVTDDISREHGLVDDATFQALLDDEA